MRVAFDIDGVLYPWMTAVHDWCTQNNICDPEMEYASFSGTWFQDKNKMFQDNICSIPIFYELFPPGKRLMEFLKGVASHHQIYYITARPLDVERVTRRFFEKYNYPYSYNLIFSDNKGYDIVRNRISMLVEDNIDTVNSCAKHCACYLVNQPWNENKVSDPRVIRIDNVFDTERILLNDQSI